MMSFISLKQIFPNCPKPPPTPHFYLINQPYSQGPVGHRTGSSYDDNLNQNKEK